MRWGSFALLGCLTLEVIASPFKVRDDINTTHQSDKRALQNIVTWDANSLFIHGERVVIYGAEFHPFRLPVPSLWLDIFQKIRAAGYNTASIYWDWALLEGKSGDYSAAGVFDVGLFLDIAKEAGVYIIARPGPYINAEVSGGGFPGWLARNPAHLRTKETGYLDATQNYVNNIGKTIASRQITNGGAVILFQPENEYLNGFAKGYSPDVNYIQDVENQWRGTGIVVPFTDNSGGNLFLPGSGTGAIDLYGIDSYPQGFSCNNPYNWASSKVPTSEYSFARARSSGTPPMIPEFQGGSFDPWGGSGFDNCAILTNEDFEKVFYKNNFASALKIVSYYMTYGGTNWGNLGYSVGYTSYDYGAAIAENREINRAKYSEAKLIANFWQASPAYATSNPGTAATTYTDQSSLTVTPVHDTKGSTGFYVVRHNGAEQTTFYKLKIPTDKGTITVPQIQGSLTLVAKDSKIHVADYYIGGYTVLYSSAEIFTHQTYSSYSIAIFYGGIGETHELAFSNNPGATVVSGSGVNIATINGATVVNWQANSSRKIVKIGADLYIYLVDRNAAYNYWVTYLPGTGSDPFGTFSTRQAVVLNGGYLIRKATVSGNSLYVTGDLNQTITSEVIGAPVSLSNLYFNGAHVRTTAGAAPILSGQVDYFGQNINVPNLASLNWKTINSLPELNGNYDDSQWVTANLAKTQNNYRPTLTTPTSLYATDYGFNTGTLVYRGHFKAPSSASGASITLLLAGGEAFSASVWLGGTFLGSYGGSPRASSATVTYKLPNLNAGTSYVLTIVIDQTGFEESQSQGADIMKQPRGIYQYAVASFDAGVVSWKVTGNLHGESYEDRTRGPLNEGGMYAERQGYHLPGPPSSGWASSSPLTGTKAPGLQFYTASFNLNLPTGYDIPLAFVFPSPSGSATYRVQLFVNGWQFGKYVHNIGPQTSFPVPEGILNYQGTNYIALSLWSQDAGGNALSSLNLVASYPKQTGYGTVGLVSSPGYSARSGAY